MTGAGDEVCNVLQGGYKYHQYQVVGRHLPTEKEPEPTIYRMKLWATDPVRAKSKFWCGALLFTTIAMCGHGGSRTGVCTSCEMSLH